MTVIVEDANYLPVDFDRVRNPDSAFHRVVDSLRNGGLSRSRQSRKEQRAPRVDDAT